MLKNKTFWTWVAILLCAAILLRLTDDSPDYHTDQESFLADVEAGAVTSVRVQDNQLTVGLYDGTRYSTYGVMNDELLAELSEAGVPVAWGEESNPIRTVLVIGVPVVLLIGLFLYFLKKQAGAGGLNVMELKKSRARLLDESSQVKFADVGGCDDAKRSLADVVDFLADPERWTAAGARLPRGVLLEGPPGCGKTLLARAVAGETNANFYAVSASEFVELFVGVGAARMRDTFEMAAKEAPAVVFIDELDAIGRKRGSGISPAHEEREQTLNQLLVSMDGFTAHERVVVIAATNRPDVLDAALVRPGRFDRRVAVPALSRSQRAEVLAIHARGKALADEGVLADVAERTEGYSGARLENVVNEAAVLAVRRSADSAEAVSVTRQDFEDVLEAAAGDPASRFDRVDALLMESTTQLAQSTGKAQVRATLAEGALIEGELVWADALFLKIRSEDGAGVLVSKAQVKTLEALEGTGWADPDDVSPDRWLGTPTIVSG